MAVVTHGGILPDSSQKTDFYGIIDNSTVTSIVSADISNSAGIMDTQLNTISTAGKVNTSALTGQIANANLAQLTTAALVSGAALTLLGNISSGAGTIPFVNLGISAKTYGTSTSTGTAITSGLIIVIGQVPGFTASQAVTNLPFTSNTSYFVVACGGDTTLDYYSVVMNSGSQFTIYCAGNNHPANWIAIGT